MDFWTILLNGSEAYTVSSIHGIVNSIKQLQGQGRIEIQPSLKPETIELIHAMIQ